MKAVTTAQQTLADRAVNAARGLELVGGVTKVTSDELNAMARTVAKGLDAFRALGTDVPPELTKVSKAIQAQQAALKGAASEAGTLTTRMVAVGAAIGTFAGNLAADAFKRIGSAMIGVVTDAFKMNASLETTKLKFTTLMGDSDQAASHVKDLFEIAKKTPFETGPIIEASLKLQTFGGAALNTKANILLLGDASAATGAPINELGFWVGRMYAMLQSGKPFGEAAMRLQELAVLSPQARDQMEAMQKSGKSAAEIFDVFKDSLSGFTGAMATQAGTWEGVMSTFTDTVNMMMAGTLLPYFEVIRDLGKNVNDALDGMSSSLDGVAASTARTKQGFADFVTGSLSATITAISFVMVEFNALQVVFRDVMQVVQGVALAFEYAALGVARLLNVASFGKAFGDDIVRINSNIDSLLQSIAARGAALQQDKAAEKDWIDWGNKAVESIKALTDGIGKASTVTAVHTGKVTAAVTQATKLTAAQKSAANTLREYNSVAETAQKTVDGMNQATVEGIRSDIARGIAQGTIGKIYGVTKEQIDAIINVDKENQKSLDETIKRMDAFGKVGEQGAKAVADGMKGMSFVLKDLAIQMGDLQLAATKSFAGMQGLMPDLSANAQKNMREMRDGGVASLDDLARSFEQLANIAGGAFGGIVKDIGIVIAAMSAGAKAGETFMKGLDKIKAGQTKAGFAELSTGVFGMVGAMDAATQSTSRVKATLGGAATGMKIGMQVAGPYGAAVGAVAGALIGYFRSAGAAERETNKLRQAWVDAAGGLGALNEKAAAAGVTLDKLLQAKNAVDYKKAIDDLTAAFAAQEKKVKENSTAVADFLSVVQRTGGVIPEALKAGIQKLIDMKLITGDVAAAFAGLASNTEVDFKTLQDIAQKYGADLTKLGPAFEAARLRDLAKDVVNDFDTLARGLGDVDEALRIMKKPINDLVNDSLKAGIAIPENFRPWIEQLLKTGQLTDENGDKITDISKLTFAPPIVSEFDKIIAKLQELIDKIGGTIGRIGDIPRNVDVDINYRDNRPNRDENNFAAQGGLVTRNGILHASRGARLLPFLPRGTDTVPAMLTPGERVLTVRETQAYEAGGTTLVQRGMSTAVLEHKLDQLRAELATDRRLLPKALRDAILLAGRAG